MSFIASFTRKSTTTYFWNSPPVFLSFILEKY
jgi:hypothetical protein